VPIQAQRLTIWQCVADDGTVCALPDLPIEAVADAVGPAFTALYTRYEAEGRGRKTVSAQKLWFKILDSQIETGTPYLLYKDACNLKSNQQNLGTIKSSNLCSEIVEYSSPEETAVCNLASMNLPAYVEGGTFNFKRFRSVVKQVVESLNRVIDINYYPIPEARLSNMRHRPIGIGVQGLADVFAILRISWESEAAVILNRKIFAHMYYAAVESSMDCALRDGVYETYAGSPASKGALQFTLWGQEPLVDPELDWDYLLHMMGKIGLRNSLLIAPMPTDDRAGFKLYASVSSGLNSTAVCAYLIAKSFKLLFLRIKIA
jgi:ribonucleoside-diphosphate reductase subunit M1